MSQVAMVEEKGLGCGQRDCVNMYQYLEEQHNEAVEDLMIG